MFMVAKLLCNIYYFLFLKNAFNHYFFLDVFFYNTLNQSSICVHCVFTSYCILSDHMNISMASYELYIFHITMPPIHSPNPPIHFHLPSYIQQLYLQDYIALCQEILSRPCPEDEEEEVENIEKKEE